MVLFSDGESHDHSKAVRVAQEMRDNGVEILCVGIGNANGQSFTRLMKQLKEISSKPEYTFKTTMNALNTIENSLVKDMCEAISKYTQLNNSRLYYRFQVRLQAPSPARVGYPVHISRAMVLNFRESFIKVFFPTRCMCKQALPEWRTMCR